MPKDWSNKNTRPEPKRVPVTRTPAVVGGKVSSSGAPGGNGRADDQAARLDALKAAMVKRRKPRTEDEQEEQIPEQPPVSFPIAGRIVELTFNATREKMREVTVIDRLQGRLFPQLDMINTMRKYCLEIAFFRQDSKLYRKLFKRPQPVSPDALDEYLYRTAQWQKSVGGKNMDRAIDIALAETEAEAGRDDYGGDARDPWGKE